MHAAFPRPEYYGGSAPSAPSAGVAPIPAPAPPAEGGAWNERGWFPRSLLPGQRARHPALPLRHRHGYAAVLHRGLQARAGETQPGVPRHGLAGTHRNPARIHRVRAGRASRGVTTPVPRVYLPVLLTAPAPSGSPGTTRLCRGCSRPPRRPAAQAASSFTPPLRRQGDKGLPPPSGTDSASWRTTSSSASLDTSRRASTISTAEQTAHEQVADREDHSAMISARKPGQAQIE